MLTGTEILSAVKIMICAIVAMFIIACITFGVLRYNRDNLVPVRAEIDAIVRHVIYLEYSIRIVGLLIGVVIVICLLYNVVQ